MADDVAITAGAGTTVATDDIGGRHFQRMKPAVGEDGVAVDVSKTNPMPTTLVSTAAVYRVFVPGQAVGANKVFFDLFNAAGSGKVMKIKSVRAIKQGQVAVTGALSVQLFLTRTTAVGTGGTAHTENGTALNAIAISEHDSANAALPAQVTARSAPAGGATAGPVIAERHVFVEETNASTYDRVEFLMPEGLDVQPLTCREGEGIRVVQGTVASVGTVGFNVLFELE